MNHGYIDVGIEC